jgi:hypothetical protein
MSEQHNLELKEKARTYVKEKRWDYLLVNAYLETKYFTSWSKRDDFEEQWNIGLTNISSETQTLVCGYKKNENNEFLVANFNDIKFEIGGFRDTAYMPDGDAYTTLSIVLLIDEQVVLSIRYSEDADDPYRASDYNIVSVEELHSNLKISELLEGIEKAVYEKDERDKLKRKHQENNSYEGKFTFDLDEVETKNYTPALSENNLNSIEEQGKSVGKFVRKNIKVILFLLLVIFFVIFFGEG